MLSAGREVSDDAVIADMRRWLERAVIGLNLCPFARAVHVKGQVHYAVCDAARWSDLAEVLAREAHALLAEPPQRRETTLLMVPVLADFIEFTGFVAEGERILEREGLTGVLQLASFHPDFQFAGTAADDITNRTNRAPWPTLHLLREDSIAQAVRAVARPESIYEANMRTLRELGPQGWNALGVGRGP